MDIFSLLSELCGELRLRASSPLAGDEGGRELLDCLQRIRVLLPTLRQSPDQAQQDQVLTGLKRELEQTASSVRQLLQRWRIELELSPPPRFCHYPSTLGKILDLKG